MKKARKIRRIVEQLLQRSGINSTPVDVRNIAQVLGVALHEEALGDISGMLFRENGQIVIGVNSTHYEHRKRFTIAHEIGHLQLHTNPLYVDKVFPVRLRDQMSSEAVYLDEIEANAFAAELLMPTFMLENEAELKGKIIDYERSDGVISDLAKRYEVSIQAMTFRLVNLGFIVE